LILSRQRRLVLTVPRRQPTATTPCIYDNENENENNNHVYTVVDDDHDGHGNVEGAEGGVELVTDLLADCALVRVDLGAVEEQWRDADEC